jgi:hypothetical protein
MIIELTKEEIDQSFLALQCRADLLEEKLRDASFGVVKRELKKQKTICDAIVNRLLTKAKEKI